MRNTIYNILHLGSPLRALRWVAVLVVMMACVMPAKAQTDYSGVYYLNSRGKDGAQVVTVFKYYLCPTEGWCYYVDPDDYTGTVNGQPFITTYKCKEHANDDVNPYDVRKAVWIIEKQGNYYSIKHAMDGEYLVFNGQIATTPDAGVNRCRVHIESMATPNDKALFTLLTRGENIVAFVPKTKTGWVLTVNQGNYDQLDGNSVKTDGPSGYPNTGGIVGIWNNTNDANAPFYLEEAVQRPVISQADNGDITITCATSNTTIYYTLNGSDPVVPADGEPDPTGPTYKYTTTFTPALGSTGVKAVAVLSNLHAAVSRMAEELVFEVCSTPTISFNGVDQVTITATPAIATIYYTTDGSDPVVGSSSAYSGSLTVTTNTTVKAIAAHTGYVTSGMASLTISKVATPIIQDNGHHAISITCATEGADIYYTIDNTDPSVGSLQYTEPITNSGVLIRAIAVKENMITSDEASATITLQCATPIIRHSGNGFQITCAFPSSGVTIYYETGSDEASTQTPTTSSASISSGGTVPVQQPLPIYVKAIAVATNYTDSDEAGAMVYDNLDGSGTAENPYLIPTQDHVAVFIELANSTDGANKYYKVTSTEPLDFSDAYTDPITQVFSGFFDGNYCILTGLSHPLFNTVNDGTVRNVMLKDVNVSGSGNIGAIAGEAKGYSRIYNCGILPATANFPHDPHSTVTATDANCSAGGIVGKLEDDSRVVNCFSYADVSSNGYAAGIVGNNTFASDASVTTVEGVDKYTNLRTMVVNCMFYGDITSGSEIWPVYGGVKIKNGGGFDDNLNDEGKYAINNYNFYSDSCNFSSSLEGHYNCSWPALYEYLTRYEYHRYLLNSNRELCGWWVGAPSAPSTMSTSDVQAVPKNASLMGKWVLDRFTAPFPILKPFGKYSSPINIDADSSWRTTANKWEGRKLGTLSVTIKSGAQYTTADVVKTITITDMDTLHGDYCYRKIQLPYYNTVFGRPNSTDWTEKYAGNYKDYVVTGWDITSVTGGTPGTFIEDWQDGYNFADRDCTDKDTHRTFAQGGFYYVPNNVTAIEITAHWGKAVYLGNGDNCYDRVDFDYLVKKANNDPVLRENRAGSAFAPAGTRSANLPNNKPIQTGKIADVANNNQFVTGDAVTVYDNAIVLVSNHQYCTGDKHVNPSRKFTIMSADFDFDEEPDYCLEWQLGKGTTRFNICPIRFDFLPVEEVGLCLKKDGSFQYYSLGCYIPQGHFEVTETSLIRFGQFEFGNNVNPLILNGGIYNQYCKGTTATGAENDKTKYIIIGGNIYMPYFTPGAHVRGDSNKSTRHCAVNVIGGKYKELYLTGNFNNSVTPNTDNPHCYIDGGWFDQVAAAGKEGVDGDVYFKINHARIKEFYGGSTMDKSNMVVKGSIDVTIDSSHVRKYCGGPKFGNMNTDQGKTVTTRATNTHFGVYYGAGNGGTSYAQCSSTDVTYNYFDANGDIIPYPWNTYSNNTGGNLNYYVPNTYLGDPNYAYKANYDMEIINTSSGTYNGCAVIRTYFYAAQFAATNTGMVTNTLDRCIVDGNFYGAGKLGGVVGKEVDGVTVGVTSTLNDTEVKGSVFGAGYSADIPEVNICKNKDAKTKPSIDLNTGIVTPQVEDASDFNIYTWTNETSVGGHTLSTGNPTYDGLDVFYTLKSLVDLGKVNGNVTLTLKGNTTVGTLEGPSGSQTLKAGTGNVYGGGDMSKVNGNTTVNLQEGAHVLGSVYGGGNEGEVGGNSEVIIQNPQNTGGSGN